MQAVLNSNISTNYISEKLDFLLSSVDSNTKNDVENSIVAMGSNVVDELVDKLTTLKGLQRGVVAMSLIRIGQDAVSALREFAQQNKEYQWMADYLLSEI